MSFKQQSVDGVDISNCYGGYKDDGTFVLVGAEKDQNLLFSGIDSRAAQTAKRDRKISVPVLMRLHEVAVRGDDIVAKGFLRTARDEGWEVTNEVPQNGQPYPIAELASRVAELTNIGVCPHAKSAAGVISAALCANASAIATTPVI